MTPSCGHTTLADALTGDCAVLHREVLARDCVSGETNRRYESLLPGDHVIVLGNFVPFGGFLLAIVFSIERSELVSITARAEASLCTTARRSRVR